MREKKLNKQVKESCMEWSFPHISMKDMRSKVTDKKKIEKEAQEIKQLEALAKKHNKKLI